MSLNNMEFRLLKNFVILLFISTLAACGNQESDQTDTMHLDRARAYQEQGQYKAATIEYKNAVRNSGGEAKVTIQYADMLNTLGHYRAALNMLEQVKGDKTEAYYLELVETFIGMKKYLSAEATMKDFLTAGSREVKLLEGEILLGMGELKAARNLYSALLVSNESDNEALLGKATALVREGDAVTSLKLLDKINPESKTHRKAKILKAGIQINLNQLEKAEATLSELLSTLPNTDIIEPEKALVLERLSYVLTRQGRSNEAYIYTKILSEAFPGANEVQEQYKTAVEKFQAGDLDAAQSELVAILEQFPSYSRATQLLGVISYLRGDNELAAKYLSESVDVEVASPVTKHIYAATNLKLNEPKKVLEILEPGIERTKAPETLALYGLAAISDKQYVKGEKALLKALKIAPDNIRVRLALAGFYRTSNRPNSQKEWEQLEAAFDIAPKDIQVLKEVVSYHLRHGSADKAGRFVKDALASNPKEYSTNIIAGYYALNQNDLLKALDSFTVAANARKAGPDLLAALFAKGKTEVSLKKMKDAEQTFEKIVSAFPESELGYKGIFSIKLLTENSESAQMALENLAKNNEQTAPYFVLIQSAIAGREIETANRYLEKIKALNPENKQISSFDNAISYVRAVDALQNNDLEQARKFIAPILVSEPDNIRVLSFLVDLELSAGKLGEAAKVLKQVEGVNPSHPVVSLLKGDLAVANKNLEGARMNFSNAWKNNPSEASGDKLFKVLGLLKATEDQTKHLNNWLTQFPDSPAATLYKAVNYQKRGQSIKAAEGYEKLLKVVPDNVLALNNLGWIYFENDDDRALVLLKKAYELAPDSPAVLDSYGWVLAKSGQVKKGLVYLEKANRLAPDVTEISDHLAEVKRM